MKKRNILVLSLVLFYSSPLTVNISAMSKAINILKPTIGLSIVNKTQHEFFAKPFLAKTKQQVLIKPMSNFKFKKELNLIDLTFPTQEKFTFIVPTNGTLEINETKDSFSLRLMDDTKETTWIAPLMKKLQPEKEPKNLTVDEVDESEDYYNYRKFFENNPTLSQPFKKTTEGEEEFRNEMF